MASYTDAYEHVLAAEGGYVLTNTPSDHGGQTYAGISRVNWPQWEGWTYIDAKEPVPENLVYGFYQSNFWEPVRGDSIMSQTVATALFSFAVNAGVKQAVKIAQRAASVTDDGKIGPITLFALNSMDKELFLTKFALAKIAFYCGLCAKDPEQKKFLAGWCMRAIKEAC